MNENAKKWIAALRGGDYEQTKRRLRDLHGFCCLGVACDVYMKTTGKGEWRRHFDFVKNSAHYVFAFESLNESGESEEASCLPIPVRRWLGIDWRNADGCYGESSCLTLLNDDDKPFSYIADTIESEPEGLFPRAPC